ncbi:MAG TPA: hypothetical protein VH496_12935 [Mycobacterium sp.]
MHFSPADVEIYAVDADADGRDESAMLVFPDQTLLCVSDNDGDGRADYAAVDIGLTKIVDFCVLREGDILEVRRFDAEGLADVEELDAAAFFEAFPGWAALLDTRFPGGSPDEDTFSWVLSTVDALLWSRWTRRSIPWQRGALYRLANEDGSFAIVKVLEVDDVGVHIRRYSNRFERAPERIDESTLSMKAFDEQGEDDFGIGHLPVSAETFSRWGAEFVQQSAVRPDELTGYASWREAGGGYF